MTSAVQFPMMFLSGTFFPIAVMPDALQTVARFLPLTYLVRCAPPGHGRRGGLCAAHGPASRSCSAGRSSASASPRAASSGSDGTPAYQPSSWTISSRARRPPRRSGRTRSLGVGRVAEREQVLAVAVRGVAEEPPGEVVVVDRRGHAADPQLPGHQHHVLGRLAEIEQHRQRRVGRGRVRRDERHRNRRPGQVAGPRTDGRQLGQALAPTNDDEVPALEVLRAARPAAGVEDPVEMLGLERAVGEAADRPFPADRVPDGHGSGRDRPTIASARGGRPVADERFLGLGRRRASTAPAAAAAASGLSGPPSSRARNAATARR